jgi:ribonuclease-3
MPGANAVSLTDLSHRIGYAFRNPELLALALVHASARGGAPVGSNNQRLEFLGDRVLGLVIAAHLHGAYPNESEGALARRYNRLVHRDTCAAAARRLDLGPYLAMSESEASAGGRDKDTILADGCEAVLGAVFLDGGFESARRVVQRLWAPLLAEAGPVPVDPKTSLQEWAQARRLPIPDYVEIARAGPDHSPVFTIEARVDGFAPARGSGASKRAAQEAAATALLIREGVWSEGGSNERPES